MYKMIIYFCKVNYSDHIRINKELSSDLLIKPTDKMDELMLNSR